MTPKHMFSLDHNLSEIVPCPTADDKLALEELFAPSCEEIVASVDYANSLTYTREQCLFPDAASCPGSSALRCQSSKCKEFNLSDGTCFCLRKENKQHLKDVVEQSVESCEASIAVPKIELLQINEIAKSSDDVPAAGRCRNETFNKDELSVQSEKLGLEDSCEHVNACETESNPGLLNIFDDLPLEIQYKILSYLTAAELCLSVAPVCKRWHGLAYEPILWQQLTFNHAVPSESVKKILQRSVLVRHLSLFGFPEVNTFLPQLVNCHFLLCLDFKMCGGVFVKSISQLVHHCPLVESLNVEGCRNIDNTAMAEIVGWKRMRCLNLSHCTLVQDESVVLLAHEFTLLQELNIDGIENISDAAVTVLVDQRKGTLQKLLLDGEDLTDVTYRSLCTCTRLDELCVSFAVLMSDQGLVSIKELTGLRNLKIKRGSELSEPGLQALFESQNLCNLTSLDLSGCSNLDDNGVDAMTKCCSRMQFLGLEWCWDISDKGLYMIVTRCSCLKVMNLVGLVKITGTSFAKVPECMPLLVYLDLQQCSRIIDDIVEDVVRRKPDLKVLDYYGEELRTDIVIGETASDEEEKDAVCVCGQHLEL